MYSIPELVNKNEDSSQEQEPVEQEYYNDISDKVTPYLSSVYTLYIIN